MKKIVSNSDECGFPSAYLREISLLKMLRHKNIIELKDVPWHDDERIFLIFEHMMNDLKTYMDQFEPHGLRSQEDCLKCSCCNCRLADVGATLFTRENVILCKSDYIRLYGNTGLCSACNKLIPAFEMVMRAKRNVYHLECFACQQCSHRFCVGDRFYLCDNKILCESDYAERQMQSQIHSQMSNQSNNIENNNSEYSLNRNTTKTQIDPTNNLMPLYSEKNNFTNYDLPIHVR